MCLILLAWQHDAEYPLILAANRDEFHDRPTEKAAWWPGDDLLAGRDLRAGGAWLGVTRDGHFATVTNFREGGRHSARKSRGRLVVDYLDERADNHEYLKKLAKERDDYAGYNLIFGRLAGDAPSLHFFSNRGAGNTRVSRGIHGLSNGHFDQRWPKVKDSLERFQGLMEQDAINDENLLFVMNDRRTADRRRLPRTGVGYKLEKMLSAPFIVSPNYGTRCTTLLYIDREGNA